MRVAALVGGFAAGALVAAAVSGCGVDAERNQVLAAAQSFTSAVAGGDGERACQLLTEEARRSTESFGQRCAEQIVQLDGELAPVQRVEVWSDSAQVRSAGDTIFLAKFPDGWKVRGAGCKPRTELPYDCEVEG